MHGIKRENPIPLNLLFPGHGTERPDMTRGLYETIESYRRDIDTGMAMVRKFTGIDLKPIVFPNDIPEELARRQLSQTITAQPALFVVEYSLAKLLERSGLESTGMFGHSVGEYAAACLAGVFSLETAVEIVCKRGQLAQGLLEGAMMAVSLSEEEIGPYLNDKVDLGSTIGQHQCVVSGYPDSIYFLREQLTSKGIECKLLKVTRAFHSMMLDPVLDAFGELMASKELHSPKKRFISGVSGRWIQSEEAQSAHYWVKQLRSPVRFYEGITTMAEGKGSIFLEVGKGATLTSLVRGHPRIDDTFTIVSTVPASYQKVDDLTFLQQNLTKLSEAGLKIENGITNGKGKVNSHRDDLNSGPPNDPPDYSPLEEEVGKYFCKILGLETIDRNRNFLEAGGNSLMAMRLISLLKKNLNQQISIKDFFENLTVAELAQVLEKSSNSLPEQAVETNSSLPAPHAPVRKTFQSKPPDRRNSNGEMKFSLFFFSGDEGTNPEDRYKLVLDGSKFADENDFDAVWIPERHFNPFGGLYPNPSVLGAAIAVTTKQIHIRGGSVVAPLHHPVRIAEEWSVLDNLSKGRTGISFGSGFHPKDFLLAPANFKSRKAVMFEHIKTIHKLWQGDAITAPSGLGEETTINLFPKPYGDFLPTWISTTRSMDSFTEAGEMGANVLTALLRLSMAELKERIQAYRQAWTKSDHPAEQGIVTVMLHTFVGPDMGYVRTQVEKPLKDYLRSHMEHTEAVSTEKEGGQINRLTTSEEEQLLEHAFQRYFESNSLIGTEESCLETVKKLKEAGVDEIACLIDFGVEEEPLQLSLKHLNNLRQLSGNLIPV